MAYRGDHGSTLAGFGFATGQNQAVFPVVVRAIRMLGGDPNADRLSVEARRDDTVGFSAPPSIYYPRGGFMRIRLAVSAGLRSVTIKAKQPATGIPRPTAKILANPSIGVNADVSATAPSGTDWVTIGPITFTPSTAGGVYLELFAPWSGFEGGCWFDNVSVS